VRGAQVGHFRDDAARQRFAAVYRECLAVLPPVDETLDVATGFGTVRVYRFAGPAGRPVMLLPGRNACTPMWAPNLPGLLSRRTVFAVDLLGEPGMSVQRTPIRSADDQAQWLREVLDGVGLDRPHLMGVSFGGWSATNLAVRRPGSVASLTLLDPVLTFAPVPLATMLAVLPMSLTVAPERYRRWALRWLAGGAEVDDAVPVARLIASGIRDFVLHQPLPGRFAEDQLRALDIPVLAVLGGRSVIHDAARAAGEARASLAHGEVELWPDASHAISGEFPDRIGGHAHRFWDQLDRNC
jgi:pimeloyl-ACP methyl ester carboxylesterase